VRQTETTLCLRKTDEDAGPGAVQDVRGDHRRERHRDRARAEEEDRDALRDGGEDDEEHEHERIE